MAYFGFILCPFYTMEYKPGGSLFFIFKGTQSARIFAQRLSFVEKERVKAGALVKFSIHVRLKVIHFQIHFHFHFQYLRRAMPKTYFAKQSIAN